MIASNAWVPILVYLCCVIGLGVMAHGVGPAPAFKQKAYIWGHTWVEALALVVIVVMGICSWIWVLLS